jgi:hypothetical protein
MDIFGVAGIVRLCGGHYLLVITDRQSAGFIQEHEIFQITKVEAVKIQPACPGSEESDPSRVSANVLDNELLESILSIMNSGKFIYSTTIDLSHSLQHAHHLASTEMAGDSVIDDRYWFNKDLSAPIIAADSRSKFPNPWVLKLVAGDASTIDLGNLNGSASIKATVIARLSTLRLGTRYSM